MVTVGNQQLHAVDLVSEKDEHRNCRAYRLNASRRVCCKNAFPRVASAADLHLYSKYSCSRC